MVEEGMSWKGAYGDLIGLLAHYFFEVFAVARRYRKEFLDEEKVEEFFLDLRVHENFIRHVRDQSS